MDVTNVNAMSQPAIRAVLLCCGDCSGREIDIPVLYDRSSGIPLAGTRALPPAGSGPPWVESTASRFRFPMQSGSPHLHILLQRRLLRQAHGFEGLAWLGEPLEAHCLAVADGPDGAVPVLDLNAASAPAPPHCGDDGDAVARVDEPLDIHPEIADSLVQFPGDGTKSLDARSGSRFKGVAWVDPLDIRVQQVRLRRGGSRRPTRVDTTDNRHVLLRHRLLPQPHGLDGVAAGAIVPHAPDLCMTEIDHLEDGVLGGHAALPADHDRSRSDQYAIRPNTLDRIKLDVPAVGGDLE